MNNTTLIVNVFSPDGIDESDHEVIRTGMDQIAKLDLQSVSNIYNASNVLITYKSIPGSNKQKFSITNANNANDVALLAMILLKPELVDESKLHPDNRRSLDLMLASRNGEIIWNSLPESTKLYLGQDVINGKVINPLTGREISRTGRRYKKVFRNIKLKNVLYKELPNYTCYPYEITDNCVVDFFKTQKKLGVRRIKDIVTTLTKAGLKDGVDIEILEKVLNDNDIGLSLYDILQDNVQDQSESGYRFHYDVCVSQGHFYPIQFFNKRIKKVNPCSDKEYAAIIEQYKNQYVLIDQESETVINQIKFKQCYENNYKMLEDILKYKANYSQLSVDFYKYGGIRAPRYSREGHEDSLVFTSMDGYSAYLSVIENPNSILSSSTGNEYYDDYRKGDPICSLFYICDVNSEDAPLFFTRTKDVGIWGPLLNTKLPNGVLIKDQFKITPKGVIQGSSSLKGAKIIDQLTDIVKNAEDATIKKKYSDYLDTLTTILAEEPKVLKSSVNKFIGTLAKPIGDFSTEFETTNAEEVEYFLDKFPVEARYNKETNKLRIAKQYKKTKCNMLLNLSVVDLSRGQLMKVYIATKMLHPETTVLKTLTDCIQFDKILSRDHMSEIYKLSKIVNKYENKGFYPTVNETTFSFNFNGYRKKKWNQIDDVKECIDLMLGVWISGEGGLGKSHYMKNVIIPYMDSQGITWKAYGANKENGKDWTHTHIQKDLLKSTGLDSIEAFYSSTDYLILDECFLLSNQDMIILEHLHSKGLKFIMIGDHRQVLGVSKVRYHTCQYWMKMVDFNKYTQQWHPNCRYDKDYYEFIQTLYNKTSLEIYNYVIDHPKIMKVDETDTNINIVWRHKTGTEAGLTKKVSYYTVEAAQGKTINEPFTIHELKAMATNYSYTALTRSKNFKNLRIVRCS